MATSWPTRAFVRLSIAAGTAGAMLGVGIWLVAPRKYTSTSEVIVASQRAFQLSGALAALGGQFGLQGAEASTSPNFVIALLTSRAVLNGVVTQVFPVDSLASTAPKTLAELLTGEHADSPRVLARARKRLSNAVSNRFDTRTGIIQIDVEMPTPLLAQQVAEALLQEADRANRRIQQTQARNNRLFIEERLRIAERELHEAEEAQRLFYQRNASFQQSPELVLEDRRLQRRIESRQEVANSLARDLEHALQGEARDVPSLSVVTDPDLPWIKSWPSGSRMLLAGLGTGIALSALLTLVAAGRGSQLRDGLQIVAAVGAALHGWLRSVL